MTNSSLKGASARVGELADGFRRSFMNLLPIFNSLFSSFSSSRSSLSTRRKCQSHKAISLGVSLTLSRDEVMLNLYQLANAILEVRMDRMDLYDFERWLRRESKNVHASGDERLIQAVFSIEAVLSEYRFANMDELLAKEELANAILPFADSASSEAKPYVIAGAQDLEMSFGVPRKPPHGAFVLDPAVDRLVGYHA